jgi:hypothetical protein
LQGLTDGSEILLSPVVAKRIRVGERAALTQGLKRVKRLLSARQVAGLQSLA